MTRNFVLYIPDTERGGRNVAQRCPLGNIQRAREEICRQLSVLRVQLNHQVCGETTNAEALGA